MVCRARRSSAFDRANAPARSATAPTDRKSMAVEEVQRWLGPGLSYAPIRAEAAE